MEKKVDIAVEFCSVSKFFKAVRANENVSFRVRSGSIHGVVGENGAGKSTAMKILYGLYSADSGKILLHNEACHFSGPQAAIRKGIGMVHQHFMLARPYSALDNIILGWEPALNLQTGIPSPLKFISRKKARERIEEIMQQTGLQVPLDKPVELLPVGVQQRIEIIKLLYREANVLILDEPTAVLTPQEVDEFFITLHKLRESGKTLILITHKLKEVKRITDFVTVFRRGHANGEIPTAQHSEEEIAELMVGKKLKLDRKIPEEIEPGKELLNLKNVTVFPKAKHLKKSVLTDLSFSVRAGEIVGIAGVEGNGQSELLQLLLHPNEFFPKHAKNYKASGEINFLEHNIASLDSADIRSLPLGVIPEDRQREAMLMDFSLDENFLLGLQGEKKYVKHGILRWDSIREATLNGIETFDVRPKVLWNKASALSGGNQQKLVIGREFSRSPKFLIAAHPTRGVDIGAIELIHGHILKARKNGVGVLLVSSELDEIFDLSDRILVFFEGKIAAEFKRGHCDEKTIGVYMAGARGR